MKKVIVSGAAGFAGCNLVEHLIEHDIFVYALVRAGSKHNERLAGYRDDQIKLVEIDFDNYKELPELIKEPCEVFFHLAWGSKGRNDFETEYANVQRSIDALESAAKLGCKRFVATGSQAEYGVKQDIITEDMDLKQFTAYGSAKVAACYLTRCRAKQLGIDWIWGRIFSLYGKYEPYGRLLPDIIKMLKNAEIPHISAATQYWDYLDAGDCAEAIIALAEKGRSGEIYNIANGDYHPLKYFMEILRERYAPDINIVYGELPNPCVTLRPSVKKIQEHTGWEPVVRF